MSLVIPDSGRAGIPVGQDFSRCRVTGFRNGPAIRFTNADENGD
jgi:hypothetical protein